MPVGNATPDCVLALLTRRPNMGPS
jgi:hypothetical protein